MGARPARTRALLPLLAWFVAGAAGAAAAPAHGGVYRGPGATVPPGPGPATPGVGGGATGAGGGTASDGWSTWWGFNREPYLDLKAALYAAGTSTGDDQFDLGSGERARLETLEPTAAELHGRVAPALVAALERERQPDVQTAALIALAKLGEPPPGVDGPAVAPVLQRHLADANQEVAESAALALGILRGESQAPVLAELLDGGPAGQRRVGREGEVPERTRAFAAFGLGLVGAASEREDVRRFVVHKLADALERPPAAQHDVRAACVAALGLVPLPEPERGDPTLEGDAAPPPTSSRDAQARLLQRVLFDDDLPPSVRGHAPLALARLAADGRPALRGEVLAAIQAPLRARSRAPVEVQQGCLSALGLLLDGDAEALDARGRELLLEGSSDWQPELRRQALVALARAAARPGAGPEPGAALAPVRARLLARLADARTPERPWAALALGLLERGVAQGGGVPSEDVRRALRAQLDAATSPDERGALATALGLLRDPAAEGPLRELLASQDDVLCGQAAVALGLLGARGAIDELRAVVRGATYRPGLLFESATALALLGDRELVPELVDRLRTAESLAAQAAIASALGRIGDRRTIEPLLTMLADTELTAGARAFAAAALGILGDTRPLPWSTPYALDVNWRAATATYLDPATGRGLLDIL